MSDITITECFENGELTLSRGKIRSSKSSASKSYFIEGVDNEIAACNAVYAAAPKYIGDTMPKDSVSVQEHINDKLWKVTVKYAFSSTSFQNIHNDDETELDDEEEGKYSEKAQNEVSFQCSASNQHIIVPINQKCMWGRDDVLSDAKAKKTPIGWNGKTGNDSSAEGVDIPYAELREQYTRILKYSTVRSSSWRRKIASCVGCVNSSSFKGWNKGEVMFMGASYQTPQTGVSRVTVTFDFLIRLNESNEDVAGHKISKQGHQYAWAVMDDKVKDGEVEKDVKYIFVADVLKSANFSTLGI